MNWSLIPIYYLSIGGIFFALVYFFNDQYRYTLKKSLLIIKTAGQKTQQAQKVMQQEYREKYQLQEKIEEVKKEEIKEIQEQYSQEFDSNIEQQTQEFQNNPQKVSRALFGLFIAWPLITFLFGIAALLSSIYLTEQELIDLENQL